ncbi:MAG TPA: alpha-L-arabinofuranosidase C-terminal domain-containing protein [Terriglobales bacterium]|nr:alpha-L-arabinofuranosidase C-terminal domain-containing protein [Terriglobales bacterium]
MLRREFVKTAALAGGGLALGRRLRPQAQAEAQIEVLLDEPIATIAPEIYGHFTEHLGGVIYDGVWVGEDSKVPNLGGIRRALVEKLRAIHAPVIRWPGGCFADSYDWRDGVGPRDKRPRRTNFWVGSAEARHLGNAPQAFEPNTFGTDEFVRFCQLSGAQPYLAANLRSLPALAFDQWVEYCNSPAGSTTYADLRAAGGSAQPYGVRYWGIGNESWGCGGNFTPSEYASEYRRFTSWVPRYGVDLKLVASGPNADDVDWTTEFFENIFGRRGIAPPWGWSVHNYTFMGDALKFDADTAYQTFQKGFSTEKVLLDHWTAMGVYDRRRRVKLVVDEYGDWYSSGTELDPSHIFGQQITMRDAIVTAFTLDIFNRNADKVAMAACAQLINCINALFLAHEDRFLVTPNYHVFDLYAAHQGATAVRAEFSAPPVAYQAAPVRSGSRGAAPAPTTASFWGLNGSASRRGKALTLTVVNPNLTEGRDTEIRLQGARAASASAQVLAAADVHAHNTFDQPNAVAPRAATPTLGGGRIHIALPPASVTRLDVVLG